MTPPSASLTIWSCFSAGLLVILSSALILSPRLLLFLSQTGTSQQRTALTSLEAFLAVHFGVYLVAVAVALILNVGKKSTYRPVFLPDAYIQTPEMTPVPSKRDKEPSHPLLAPLTIASNLLAFISWNTTDVGALATVTFVIDALLGIWGLWTVSASSTNSAVFHETKRCFLPTQAPSRRLRGLINTPRRSCSAIKQQLRRKRKQRRKTSDLSENKVYVHYSVPLNILSTCPTHSHHLEHVRHPTP